MRSFLSKSGIRYHVLLFLFIVCREEAVGYALYPDFDQSMVRERISASNRIQQVYDSSNPLFRSLFKNIYIENIKHLEKNRFSSECRIPRIVHQIWLGGKVPEKFYNWMRSWMDLSGWEYKLWTEREVAGLKLHNQDLYDQAKCYAEKSDILRLEILYQYGGVYADIDYECLNVPLLENLHQTFDFYMGFEPLEHGFIKKFHMFKVCNALIGSIAFHPLLEDLLVNIKANYFAHRAHGGALQRTGPAYLTSVICQYEKSHAHTHRNIYLPSTFIYSHTRSELERFIADDERIELCPETLGIHYWSGSWHGVPPTYARYGRRIYDGEGLPYEHYPSEYEIYPYGSYYE